MPSTPVYSHALFIESTQLQSPCTPIKIIYSLVSSLYSHISPCHSTYPLYCPCIVFVLPYIPVPFYISPLLPCIVFVLPYIPVLFYLHPLLPCIVPVLLQIPMAFYIFSLLPFFSLLIIPFINLQDNGLGSSSVKPRSKRSYHRHSTKLSIKDLALELAKKHVGSIILKKTRQHLQYYFKQIACHCTLRAVTLISFLDIITKLKLRINAKRPLTLWEGRGERRDACIFAVCFTFCTIFFGWGGVGEPSLPLQFQFKLSVICRHLICICVISQFPGRLPGIYSTRASSSSSS